MGFGNPAAFMGFVGFVEFDFTDANVVVRATSADPHLTQEITKPPVIDGRFDRSVYAIGAQIVEGSIEYPTILERTGDTDPTARLYKAAVGRVTDQANNFFGQLTNNQFDLLVRYSNQFVQFRYPSCIINTWRFSVAQSDFIKINTSIIGGASATGVLRQKTGAIPEATVPPNARIAMWYDAVAKIVGGKDGLSDVGGENIRSFEITYDNHADRIYTLNGVPSPQDIVVQKRDIDGRFVFMGRIDQLGDFAEGNQNRCFEQNSVKYGYQLNNTGCQSTFLVTAPNCVFQIEEMALTNEVFETTVVFHSMPDENDLTSSDFLQTS